MSWTYYIGGILSFLGFYLYWQMTKINNYWKTKGFPTLSSEEMGGNSVVNLFRGIRATDTDNQIYNVLKKKDLKYAGIVQLGNPLFIIKDLEVLRNVFVKDFNHFVDRGIFKSTGLDEPAGKMLAFMEGDAWKELRTKMSPTFTTGKIRRMFGIVENCSERLVSYLENEIQENNTVDFTKAYGKYTVDVISTAAFGLESGAFREKQSVFEKMSEKLQFNMTFKTIVKFLTIFMIPKLAYLLKLTFFDGVASDYFSSTISNTIKHRETTGTKRDDFLQLMIEARAGKLKSDEVSELSAYEKDAVLTIEGSKVTAVTLSEDIICAQGILFFVAGFDTTQSLLQFAAYQLAVCPEIQEKLADEVIDSFTKNGDKFSYESINEMEYMDKFVSETLRMYPPVPRLDRKCTKDYPIPGTNLILPAGSAVIVPTYAIHHDKNIFPNPERFDPERFSKEVKAQRSPYAFMPFGHGPRNCIGMRFALTEAKLAIAHLLQTFQFEPSKKTPIPMKFANSGSLKPEGGMWVILKKRKALL